jgi:hypothetical protein
LHCRLSLRQRCSWMKMTHRYPSSSEFSISFPLSYLPNQQYNRINNEISKFSKQPQGGSNVTKTCVQPTSYKKSISSNVETIFSVFILYGFREKIWPLYIIVVAEALVVPQKIVISTSSIIKLTTQQLSTY